MSTVGVTLALHYKTQLYEIRWMNRTLATLDEATTRSIKEQLKDNEAKYDNQIRRGRPNG